MTMGMLDHKKPSSPKLKKAARAVYHRVTDGPRNKWLDMRANWYLSRAGKRYTKGDKIKVAFLAQMPEVWDKQESIYEAMISDHEFDPWIVIIPAYDFVHGGMGEYGGEQEFFVQKSNGRNLILAWEENKWRDLASENFDYVFYQRPYDNYLPLKYRSNEMVKHTKICYIPYATPEARNTTIYPKQFFRNIYFGFMEDGGGCEINNEMHKHPNHMSFYNIGYPAFERYLLTEYSCNYKNVLWTPRWSYDPIVGGSHFFEYQKSLTDYPWRDATFTVRPHPLMWSNFEKEGLLSQEGAETIRLNWEKNGIDVDCNVSIEKTFRMTDILISDRSSVIPLFFLTGKPIIYCPVETDYGSLFKAIMPGLYIARNENELNYQLKMLLDRKDILRARRMEIIEEHFYQHRQASERIIRKIKADTRKSH